MIFGQNTAPMPQAPSLAAGDMIFDVTAHDFEQRVMAASMQIPVLVDFWAPWCGPCKQLMPVLEAAVHAAGGKVLLAKVNLDDNPELAQALRVQSVPAVFAFFQGQPIDAFMGAQPESKIKDFITKQIAVAKAAQPDAIDIPEALKGAAQALAEDDPATAQAIYMQILQQDEQNADAYIGIVRSFIASGQVDEAKSMVEDAPDIIVTSPNFEQAKAALDLAMIVPESGAIEGHRAKIAADPNDHQARIDLAYALFAGGKKVEATDALLESIEIDRDWKEGLARTELLTLFSAMGHTDPVTVAARRKLSSILFS